MMGTISKSWLVAGLTPAARSIARDFKTLEPVPPMAKMNNLGIVRLV